jgi:hypothetical protein
VNVRLQKLVKIVKRVNIARNKILNEFYDDFTIIPKDVEFRGRSKNEISIKENNICTRKICDSGSYCIQLGNTYACNTCNRVDKKSFFNIFIFIF